MARTLLALLVPEADPVVASFLDQHDPSARRGLGAHITLVYPFIESELLTDAALARLRDTVADVPAPMFRLLEVRTFPAAVELVKGFAGSGKPIAVICHGGWVLIEAGVVGDRTLTSWPSLQTDYRNAGATWVDEEVVVDSGAFTLVSSRKPDDLPAFNRELLAALQ